MPKPLRARQNGNLASLQIQNPNGRDAGSFDFRELTGSKDNRLTVR